MNQMASRMTGDGERKAQQNGRLTSDAQPQRGSPEGTAGPQPDRGKAATGEKALPRLSQADAKLLHDILTSGETGLARRGDLVNLHQRIVQLFTTLNEGLGEMHEKHAREDREALSARIDTLEDAVNRMEGALRIEFEPVLRKALDDVVKERMAPPPRRGRRLVLAMAAGLTLGVVFHEPLGRELSDAGLLPPSVAPLAEPAADLAQGED